MATNSILRNVIIKDKVLVKSFIEALDHAKGRKSKEVIISKTLKHLDKSEIEMLFKNKC